MDASQVTLVTGVALVAAAHGWLGERWALPRFVALPHFPESFYFDATPRVRLLARITWHCGTLAWLWLAALFSSTWWIETPHAQALIMLPMILMTGSPLILGAYLGSLLKARLGPPRTDVTVLLWVLLVLVIAAAWRAAG